MQEMQEMWVWSFGREDPLEEDMTTHSGILAWRIPWTEEPGELQSMESHRVGHNWVTNVEPLCSMWLCLILRSEFNEWIFRSAAQNRPVWQYKISLVFFNHSVAVNYASPSFFFPKNRYSCSFVLQIYFFCGYSFRLCHFQQKIVHTETQRGTVTILWWYFMWKNLFLS